MKSPTYWFPLRVPSLAKENERNQERKKVPSNELTQPLLGAPPLPAGGSMKRSFQPSVKNVPSPSGRQFACAASE